MKRIVALLLVAGTVPAAAAWLAGDDEPARRSPARQADVLAVPAAQVTRIALQAKDGSRTALRHPAERVWVPDGEGPEQSGSLMTEYEDHIFPLQAYKRISADPTDPQYGVADPDIRMRVRDARGDWHELALGGVTFTGGGNYAHRLGHDDVLYVVPKGTVDQLRSLLAGRPVVSTRTAREAEVQSELDREAERQRNRKPGDPLPPLEDNPWLSQALEAEGIADPGEIEP